MSKDFENTAGTKKLSLPVHESLTSFSFDDLIKSLVISKKPWNATAKPATKTKVATATIENNNSKGITDMVFVRLTKE
jgi:hypothetical protein